jgi:hypothetical protein
MPGEEHSRASRADAGANGNCSSIPDEESANAHPDSAQSRTPPSTNERESYSVVGGAVMTPDTGEGRERLSRLEERVDSNRRQIDTLAPLVRDVGRLQWGLDDLANDLKQFRDDMRAQRLEDEKKLNNELHSLRRSVSDQILVVTDGLKSCSNKIGDLAESQRKHHEAEQRRREEEAKTVRVEKSQDVVSRRTLYGILGAAGIAALAAIVAPILNAILT